MNCIGDFENSTLSSKKEKGDVFAGLERSDIVLNAIRKLAIDGPEADILDEALLYRELMKAKMKGLPQGKEGPEHVYLFLYTRLKVDHFPGRIDQGLRFNNKDVRKEFAALPAHEYSEDIQAYLRERRELTKHIVPPHLAQKPEADTPAVKRD